MKTIIRVLILVLTFSIASVFAQGNSDRGLVNRELLKPVDPQKRRNLMSRHAIDMASLQYFAKAGKIDVYEFDIDVLDSEGQIITITPFGELPIDIVSNGIKRDPTYGWLFGTWTGEIVANNSRQTIPVELGVTTWALGKDGQLISPDPNREYTLSQLNQENAVVPNESYLRRNEKIVYAVSGFIPLPHLRRQITVMQLGDELDTLVLYEEDVEKAIHPVSDVDSEIANDSNSEIGIERARRLEAYEAHMKGIKQTLGQK